MALVVRPIIPTCRNCYSSCAGFLLLFASSLQAGYCHQSPKPFKTTPEQMKTISYDEYLAATLEFVRQDTERFFHLTVLILGGLWALAIIDGTHHLHGNADAEGPSVGGERSHSSDRRKGWPAGYHGAGVLLGSLCGAVSPIGQEKIRKKLEL